MLYYVIGPSEVGETSLIRALIADSHDLSPPAFIRCVTQFRFTGKSFDQCRLLEYVSEELRSK